MFDTGGPEAAAFARAARAGGRRARGAVQAAGDGRRSRCAPTALPAGADDLLRGARAEAAALRAAASMLRRGARARLGGAGAMPRGATPRRAAAGDGGGRGAADPDAPTVAARVDQAEAHVGDPIRVSVVADRQGGRAGEPAGDARAGAVLAARPQGERAEPGRRPDAAGVRAAGRRLRAGASSSCRPSR